MNDKKGRQTEGGIQSYGLIDAFGANLAKEDIWFTEGFEDKKRRDQAALEAANSHREKKEKAWKAYLNETYLFWVERIVWEWELLQTAWDIPGSTFPTDHSRDEVFEAANPETMEYPEEFEKAMYQL